MTQQTRDLIFMVLLDRKRHTIYQINRRIRLNNLTRIKDELELMLKEKLVKKIDLMKGNMPITEWTLTKHPSFEKCASQMTASAERPDLFSIKKDLFLKAKKEMLKTEISVEAVIKNSDISNFENELRKEGCLNDQYPDLKTLSKKMNKKDLKIISNLLTEQEKLTKLSD